MPKTVLANTDTWSNDNDDATPSPSSSKQFCPSPGLPSGCRISLRQFSILLRMSINLACLFAYMLIVRSQQDSNEEAASDSDGGDESSILESEGILFIYSQNGTDKPYQFISARLKNRNSEDSGEDSEEEEEDDTDAGTEVLNRNIERPFVESTTEACDEGEETTADSRANSTGNETLGKNRQVVEPQQKSRVTSLWDSILGDIRKAIFNTLSSRSAVGNGGSNGVKGPPGQDIRLLENQFRLGKFPKKNPNNNNPNHNPKNNPKNQPKNRKNVKVPNNIPKNPKNPKNFPNVPKGGPPNNARGLPKMPRLPDMPKNGKIPNNFPRNPDNIPMNPKIPNGKFGDARGQQDGGKNAKDSKGEWPNLAPTFPGGPFPGAPAGDGGGAAGVGVVTGRHGERFLEVSTAVSQGSQQEGETEVASTATAESATASTATAEAATAETATADTTTAESATASTATAEAPTGGTTTAEAPTGGTTTAEAATAEAPTARTATAESATAESATAETAAARTATSVGGETTTNSGGQDQGRASKGGGGNKPCPESYYQEVLDSHNSQRQQHGASPLTYNEELNQHAQAYAEQLLKTNSFEHSKDRSGEGENLFESFSSGNAQNTSCDAKLPMDSWYKEVSLYTAFGQEPQDFMPAGHFTQIVWKGTKELGIGVAGGKVVARYKPAGNQIGAFKDNVAAKQ